MNLKRPHKQKIKESYLLEIKFGSYLQGINIIITDTLKHLKGK